MVWGPVTVDLLASEADLYSQLTTEAWGADGTVTSYAYDDNGSMTNKLVLSSGGATHEQHQYTYTLENRLSSAVITKYEGGDGIITTSSYVYNQNGVRVQSDSTTTVNGVVVTDDTKTFLIDADNPTGYAQVFEELPALGASPTVSYTIGDDVISQATQHPTPDTLHFLYDGHGSTRQLTDSSGAVTDCYAYDAYGVSLNAEPSTL